MPISFVHHFQPLDLENNAKAKRFLNEKIEASHSEEITKRLNEGLDVIAIDMNLNFSVMKPIHARWLISFYDHLQCQVNLIKQSFYFAAIYDAITMPLAEEDAFIDLV